VPKGARTSFFALILSAYQRFSGKIMCQQYISFIAWKWLRTQSYQVLNISLKLFNLTITTVNKIPYPHVKINVIHQY
jgi:hypothetical protein